MSGGGVHAFDEKLAQGEEAERRLDAHFGDRYAIKSAGPDEQRQGIDRWFAPTGIDKSVWRVQYKTDFMAGKTGNAFIETVGGDRICLPGWAYSCRADIIAYWVPGRDTIYIIKPSAIVAKLEEWFESRPVKVAKNKTYRGYGLLVPLKELSAIAEREERLSWDGPTTTGMSTGTAP